MIHIDKNQPISQRGRSHIQEWVDSKKDEDTKGNDRTFQQYLDSIYEDKSKTGNTIWDIMVDKRPLKHILLCEQGFVCCYCGRRIFIDHNTLLEHLAAKGIHENKKLIFNYDNLMACCYGSSKHVIHIVADSQETVDTIAIKYATSTDKIQELYVYDTNYDKVKKEYDIENLKVGDKILIIERSEKQQQHCGQKKEDLPIAIHPLQSECEEYFKYKKEDGEEVILIPADENDPSVEKVIETLGLNKNKVLNRDRKAAFDVALNLRKLILNRADKRELIQRQILSYSPNKKFAPSEDYPDAEYFRKAFWFVERAVFTGKIML
jgi:uncharacterized protein (TIGR02646 family)